MPQVFSHTHGKSIVNCVCTYARMTKKHEGCSLGKRWHDMTLTRMFSDLTKLS